MVIDFPPAPFSQAHQYHPSPRLSSRLLVPFGSPGSRPARLPGGSVRSPSCRLGPFLPRLIISSCHLVRLSFPDCHPVGGGLSHSRRQERQRRHRRQRGRRRGGLFFSRAPFPQAHYRSPRHHGSHHRGRLIVPSPAVVVSTAVPHSLRSCYARLIRLSSHSFPIAPGSSRNEGEGVGACRLFKQATASWHPRVHHLSSSSHRGGERLVSRLVMKRLAASSRPIHRVINGKGG